jgi:hypothetical protein
MIRIRSLGVAILKYTKKNVDSKAKIDYLDGMISKKQVV